MDVPVEATEAPPPPEVPMTVPEVEGIVRGCVQMVIGDAAFHPNKLQGWTDGILEEVLKRLAELARPFKFVVTVNVGQKAGAGMHLTSATVWDDATDGSASVHWANAGVLALVTAFWVRM